MLDKDIDCILDNIEEENRGRKVLFFGDMDKPNRSLKKLLTNLDLLVKGHIIGINFGCGIYKNKRMIKFIKDSDLTISFGSVIIRKRK